MTGWIDDIEKRTLANDNFREVVYTAGHTQLTLMSIEPGSEIGWEMHDHLDQFLRIEQGSGEVDMGASEDRVDETTSVSDDWAIIVPAGTWHNVRNTGDVALKLYSL
jgi:mannose-6-phosphate isomerase-like protein (cupin superfamily)